MAKHRRNHHDKEFAYSWQATPSLATGATRPRGCAKYVGRIGALAVALGIGAAVTGLPGIAAAETESESSGSTNNSGSPSGESSPSSNTDTSAESASDNTSPTKADSDKGTETPGIEADEDLDRPELTDATTAEAPDLKQEVSNVSLGDASPSTSDIELSAAHYRNTRASTEPEFESAKATLPDASVTDSNPRVLIGAAPELAAGNAVVESAGVSTTALLIANTGNEVVTAPHPKPTATATASGQIVSPALDISLLGTTAPGDVPANSPVEWTMLAAARRELVDPEKQTPLTAEVATGQDGNTDRTNSTRYAAQAPEATDAPPIAAAPNPLQDFVTDAITTVVDIITTATTIFVDTIVNTFTFVTNVVRAVAEFTARIIDAAVDGILAAFSPQPTNAAPLDGTFSLAATTPDGVVTGTVTATDPNGDPLTYAGSTTTTKGTVVVDTDGTFTYTPTDTARHNAASEDASASVRSDTFVVTAGDGKGGTLPVTVSVTIAPANAIPEIVSATTEQPDPDTGIVTGTVTGTDNDNDTLTFSGTATTAKGSVIVETDGTFTYTPTDEARQAAADTEGPDTDTFTVTVADGHGGTDSQIVTVTIAPDEDPGTSEGVAAFPLGSLITGANGYTYQFVIKLDTESSAFSTGLVIVRPDGTSRVSDFVPGLGVNQDSATPIPRQDGSITILVSGALITFTPDGGNTVGVTLDSGTSPLWASDGAVYVVAPTTKQVSSLGVTETVNSFKVTRVGPGGAVSTHTYDGGADQYATLAGAPALGPNGTLFLAINNYSPVQPVGTDGSRLFFVSHAALLAIPATGEAAIYPVAALTGPEPADTSAAVGVATSTDGTAYLAAFKGEGADDDFRLTHTVLVLGATGTQSRIPIPGFIASLKPAGRFAVVNWYDDSDDTMKTSFIDSRGIVATVPVVGDFLASPDGTLYSISGPAGQASLTATSPSGIHAYPLGGAAMLDAEYIKFASDGTPFVFVLNTEESTFSIAVPTAGRAGPSLPLPANQQHLDFRVIGDVAVVTTSYPNSSSVLVIDSGGAILAHRTVDAQDQQMIGPVTVDEDGTVFIALITNEGTATEPDPVTTIWAVDHTGWESVSTTPGTATGLGISADGALQASISVYGIDETNGTPTATTSVATVVAPAPVVSPSLTTDPVTGVVSGTLTVDAKYGPVSFSGSVSGLLGQLVVNPDGSITFTPSQAARDYAKTSGKINQVVVVVTATDAQGRSMKVPVSLRLVPTDFPTTPHPQVFPLRTEAELRAQPGYVPGWVDADGALSWTVVAMVLTDGRNITQDPCTLSEPCSANYDYAAMSIAYNGETGQSATRDVYVISLLNTPGRKYHDPLVLGFRKMTPGDAIMVKDDMMSSDRVENDGDVISPYIDHWTAVFVPGTFPDDWFYTREDGTVGGFIFDNEIPDDGWQPWEHDWANAQSFVKMNEELSRNFAGFSYGATSAAGWMASAYNPGGSLTLKVIDQVGGQLVTRSVDPEDWVATNTSMWVIESDPSPAPPVGIPD